MGARAAAAQHAPTPHAAPPFVASKTLFRTDGFAPFAVTASPYDGGLVAVAAARNFGLKGGGRMYVCDVARGCVRGVLDLRDGVFDVAWSEVQPDELVCGGGDGRVHRLRLASGAGADGADGASTTITSTTVFQHAREVSSIDWSPHRLPQFLSTGWDGCVQVHGPGGSHCALRLAQGVVHEARWAPRHPHLLAAVASDAQLRVVDERVAPGAAPATLIASPLDDDLLSLDWSKYDDFCLATAGPADLNVWDLRCARAPTTRIPCAHARAIKRVRFSPWCGHQLASVGCDMALRTWDLAALNPRAASNDEFTEFATGLDWSLHARQLLYACGWDETVRSFYL